MFSLAFAIPITLPKTSLSVGADRHRPAGRHHHRLREAGQVGRQEDRAAGKEKEVIFTGRGTGDAACPSCIFAGKRTEFSPFFAIFHPACRALGMRMVSKISSSVSWRAQPALTPAERMRVRERSKLLRNSRTSLRMKVGRRRGGVV